MEVAAACKEQDKLYEYQGGRTLKFKLKNKQKTPKNTPTNKQANKQKSKTNIQQAPSKSLSSIE